MTRRPRYRGKEGGIPTATYRLQFNAKLTFRQAEKIVPYLKKLGITDCYASPIFEPAPGSTHGYDICRYDRINPELGGEKAFNRFTACLRKHGLGLLLDMVPNHMSASLHNPWWRDVLIHGRKSRYARDFDINWHSSVEGLRGKVLVPVLEAPLEQVVDAGKLHLTSRNGQFFVSYYQHEYPLSPDSIAKLRRTRRSKGKSELGLSSEELMVLLEKQNYRLDYWRATADRINYRRFFNVSDLVGIRMERPEVFEKTHGFLLRLVRKGKVNGVRIDHPDGLWNPKQYFDRLQRAGNGGTTANGKLFVVAEKILSDDEKLPNDWQVNGTTGYDFLNRLNGIFVLCRNEQIITRIYREFTGIRQSPESTILDAKHAVLSTTLGSEVNNLSHQLHEIATKLRRVDAQIEKDLKWSLIAVIAAFPIYRTYITSQTVPPGTKQQFYIKQALANARSRNPYLHPKALNLIGDLLLTKLPSRVSPKLRSECLRWTMRFQQLTGPAMAKGLEDTANYRSNRLVSLNEVGGDPSSFGISVQRFHKYNLAQNRHWPHSLLATSTHDTKRGEDARASINVLSEIPAEWNRRCLHWKKLNAGKKTMLDGVPVPDANDEYLLYQNLIGAFSSESNPRLDHFKERISAYMIKALREAKIHTRWSKQNAAYEEGTTKFVAGILDAGPSNRFLRDFRRFQRKIAWHGMFNSLSQTLLKMTAPGIPDFYQGTELWDLNLVDPDNRRPVDFKVRMRLLHDLIKKLDYPVKRTRIRELLKSFNTGQLKLYLIWRALGFRRENGELFGNGDYMPLRVTGSKREHICAFARRKGNDLAITVCPRFIATLSGGSMKAPTGSAIWGDSSIIIPSSIARLMSNGLENVFTGELIPARSRTKYLQIRVSRVLKFFPAALLSRNAE